MRNRSKLLIAAVTATILLAIAAAGASARNFELTNWERGFKISWSNLTLESFGRSLECPITLEGTFERHTFAKLANTRLGKVVRLAIGTCRRNSVVILRESFPWEVTYNSFAGSLPTITSLTMDIVGMALQVNLEGVLCLMRTRAEQPFRGIARVASGGAITGYRADETVGIETSGGFFCSLPGPAHFSGEASTTVGGSGSEAITIRLI